MDSYYFWTDWTVRRKLAETLEHARKERFTTIRARVELKARIAHLEDELIRVNFVASALADLCVEKGFATADELMDRIARRAAAHAALKAQETPPKPPVRRRRAKSRGGKA